jgi:hypothetical protein
VRGWPALIFGVVPVVLADSVKENATGLCQADQFAN